MICPPNGYPANIGNGVQWHDGVTNIMGSDVDARIVPRLVLWCLNYLLLLNNLLIHVVAVVIFLIQFPHVIMPGVL